MPIFNAPIYRSVNLSDVFDIHKFSCEFKSYIRDLQQIVFLFESLLEKDAPKLVEELASFSVDINKGLSNEVSLALKKYEQVLNPTERKNLTLLCKYFSLRQNVHGVQMKLSRENAVNLIHQNATYLNVQELVSMFELEEIVCKEMGKLNKQKILLHKELKKTFDNFPFEHFASKLRTRTLSRALNEIKEKSSFTMFFDCWNALSCFDAENFNIDSQTKFNGIFEEDLRNISGGDYQLYPQSRIDLAYTLLKDFTDVLTVLYVFLIDQSVKSTDVLNNQGTTNKHSRLSISNLVDIYDKINNSPIVETIVVIGGLIGECAKFIEVWQKQNQKPFASWLKANWVTVPIFVGVVAIKLLKYLSDKKNNAIAGVPHLGENESPNINVDLLESQFTTTVEKI